jgi:DNA-binding NarL/FixJ family response regulator
MKDKIRIHLADDQVLIDGMSTLLNTVSDFEVRLFFRRYYLYDDVTNSKANILILDISMPKRRIAVIKEFAKRISL